MTEVTPHPLKTQGFHHFFILLFYDHPAERQAFFCQNLRQFGQGSGIYYRLQNGQEVFGIFVCFCHVCQMSALQAGIFYAILKTESSWKVRRVACVQQNESKWMLQHAHLCMQCRPAVNIMMDSGTNSQSLRAGVGCSVILFSCILLL